MFAAKVPCISRYVPSTIYRANMRRERYGKTCYLDG